MPPMANGGMQRGVYGRAESPYNADYLTAPFASGSSNGAGTTIDAEALAAAAIQVSGADVVAQIVTGGGGSIVNVGSISAMIVNRPQWQPAYNASKAAVHQLTKSLAAEWAPHNIRVNSIAPGSILFPGGSWHKRQQADPEGIAEFVKRELPFGRFGRAEEVGDVIAFLASPRASWISGASITVDGCQSRSNI